MYDPKMSFCKSEAHDEEGGEDVVSIKVLDKGYVSLADTNLTRAIMGSDLSPVNGARASFLKASEYLTPGDIRLIQYLAEHTHTSPFRHATVTLETKAPFMIARQWFKYRVGWEHGPDSAELVGLAVPEDIAPALWDFLREAVGFVGLGADQFREDNLTARNEASRRYVTLEPEWYVPQADQWRSAPENKKQGSGESLATGLGLALSDVLKESIEDGMKTFTWAMEKGVAPEMARGFLPNMYFMYTVWRWTASLQGVAFFIWQRVQKDAQDEITDYALAVWDLLRPYFPNSLEQLVDKRLPADSEE